MCSTNTRKIGRLSSLIKRSDCCSFSEETLPHGGITAGIGGFRAVLCVPPRVRKRIPVFPA